MRKQLVVVGLSLLLIISGLSGSLSAYNSKRAQENYIAYRIKYIHRNAYNTDIRLPEQRVKAYAAEILDWSNYYSQKLNVNIDPLLVTAIIEAETNFVSRSDYDNGLSIGVGSMKIDTVKWLVNKSGIEYNKWRVMDATDLGIRFAVYYIGLAYQQYDNLSRVIVSYNQGFRNASRKKAGELYNDYLFKVLGRYDYYRERIRAYGSVAGDYFAHKFDRLD